MKLEGSRFRIPFRNPSDENNLPRMVQFSEASEDYRCCCDSFHVRTGALLVTIIELLLLSFLLINSLFLIIEYDRGRQHQQQDLEQMVLIPFTVCIIGLVLAGLGVLMLFVGIARNCPFLLVPHMIMQMALLVCSLAMLLIGALALSTDRTMFYRILNATSFVAPPGSNTVHLDSVQMTRVYATMSVFTLCFSLTLWFLPVVYACYRYLSHRGAYMRYCRAYCIPMKTLASH